MNDPDHVLSWPYDMGDDLPDGLWDRNRFTADEERPAVEPEVAFASLAFIGAALKRRAWFWCTAAVVGLLIGAGLYVKFPAPYQASATVLLKEDPSEDPSVAIETDATLAQSRPVAERVIQQLGLPQTVSSLLASDTVTVETSDVLMFTATARTSNEAMLLASALATNFLQNRANYVQSQEQQTLNELNQQFIQAQQQVDSINAQISQVSAQPSSSAQKTQLSNLQVQRGDEVQIEQYANAAKATAITTTYEMVKYSQVIDAAAPLPHPRKRALEDIGGGLVAGLAVGMGIVIIQALVSRRLRRRDDIAHALGAPVRLSIRTSRVRRRLPAGHRLTNLDMRRVVALLNSAVPGSSRGPAGLAVVAVDNARVVAPAVVSLAASCARSGKQVVVADLSGGPLASLLKVRTPGVHKVSVNGADLTAVVPDRNDVEPVGPLHGGTSPVEPSQARQALITACASADLLLTLAILDPAFGGDHLVTWATDVVAVVTAGQSSAERIRGVGEMIRVAGMRLDSVVLVGADQGDESLGVSRAPDVTAPVRPF